MPRSRLRRRGPHRREIDAAPEIAFDGPGFTCAVGDPIPNDSPVENALFRRLSQRRNR